MSEVYALVVFAFVTAVTPGPNNALLWASGLQYGFRRSLPLVFGTSVGVGSLAVAVAAGLGTVVTAVPEIELALRLAASAYLLFLAWQIAGAHGMEGGAVARPLRLHEAAVFQYVNPKAWLFAVAAVSAFRPEELPVAVGSAVVVVTMMIVVVVTAALWAAGGTALHRLAADRRSSRALGVTLAILLVASIAFLWT